MRLDEAFGASKLFYEETKDDVKCICILDRDYFPSKKIEEQIQKANESYLRLHIWHKKEKENYLFVPTALFRISKLKGDKFTEFCSSLDKLLDEFKFTTISQISTQIHQFFNGKKEVST